MRGTLETNPLGRVDRPRTNFRQVPDLFRYVCNRATLLGYIRDCTSVGDVLLKDSGFNAVDAADRKEPPTVHDLASAKHRSTAPEGCRQSAAIHDFDRRHRLQGLLLAGEKERVLVRYSWKCLTGTSPCSIHLLDSRPNGIDGRSGAGADEELQKFTTAKQFRSISVWDYAAWNFKPRVAARSVAF